MAQKPDDATRKKWKCGQKCEIYCRSKMCWVKGEVIDIFTDEEGEWIKVKYGRNTKEMPPNDEHIRKIVFEVKWHNLVEAVRQELYPLIATALGQSVDELVATGTLKELEHFSHFIHGFIPQIIFFQCPRCHQFINRLS